MSTLTYFRLKGKPNNIDSREGSHYQSPQTSGSSNALDASDQHRHGSPRGSVTPALPEPSEGPLDPRNGAWGTEALQPVGILSREAQSGRFTLESILSVPDDSRPSPATIPVGSAANSSNPDDPIVSGILSFPVALGLFDSFMRCSNSYISQLDPKLHTFEYVQQKSAFLLTAILTASSKAFHPSLHPHLRSHTQKLLGQAFTDGHKSIETVQAILIFIYWKEPSESRTWLLVGYAIRMCIELGCDELKSNARNPWACYDEIQIRQARNIERTWLVLFVYDRSLSLQLGKPWMIEQNDLILKADAWHLEEFAVPSGDLLLSAFVCLRIASSEMLQVMSPAPEGGRTELLSKLLNNSISMWETSWLSLFDSEGVEPCQRFLAHFYGLHLRLLFNSYPLQISLKNLKNGTQISKSALWLCSSSAMGMLEQVSKEFGPLKQLYFVQDSIHLMTAYAAIFLIKLLVSLPRNMRSDLEGPSLQAILLAANTFEQQCATNTTGCAMQARFLKKVVREYQSLKTRNSEVPQLATSRSERTDFAGSPNAQTSIQHTTNPDDTNTNTGDFADSGSLTDSQAGFGTGLFADKNMWETLFSDSGFWMEEGIFPIR